MMDISALLSILWNKISRPIPNLLIGLAFLIFAPDQYKWSGWIFVAIGLSDPFDFIQNLIKSKVMQYYKKKRVSKSLCRLNYGERELIARLVSEEHQTFSIKNDHYYPSGGSHIDSQPRLFDTCAGLQLKELLVHDESKSQAVYNVPDDVWEEIEKLYKKDRNYFAPILFSKNSEQITLVSQ